MSEMKKETPVFVPKNESPDAVELSLDDALAMAVKLQKEQKEAKKVLDNVKAVIKAQLKSRGEDSYESPEGHKAQWVESKRETLDKEGIKELLGEDFSLVTSYKTVKSFKVS